MRPHPAADSLASGIAAAGLDWLVPDWPAARGVRALSTTRHGIQGSALDFSRHGVIAAYEQLRRLVPDEPLWLRQVHGVAVCDADVANGLRGRSARDPTRNSVPDPRPEADAAVARAHATLCAVLSADCLPVLFCDQRGTVVAAAHAGWRGLAGGVLEATIHAMGVRPADIMVWMGPAIGPHAFQVGADVFDAFCRIDEEARRCFVVDRTAQKSEKWHADLYALARRRLVRAGIDAAAIYGGNRCTFSEPGSFFSYRRGGVDRDARMATMIWIER